MTLKQWIIVTVNLVGGMIAGCTYVLALTLGDMRFLAVALPLTALWCVEAAYVWIIQ